MPDEPANTSYFSSVNYISLALFVASCFFDTKSSAEPLESLSRLLFLAKTEYPRANKGAIATPHDAPLYL